MSRLKLREHRFLGATQSLCPHCLAVIPAKILSRNGRVYFRKQCPQHGVREDFVCSDDRWFDRMEYSLPGKVPSSFAVSPQRGCPYDCGLCTEHEQHTCVAVLEISSSCNLTCPLCYASSKPGGVHVSVADCQRAIDFLVRYEGRPEILQLSGGEPTIHPQFVEILDYACRQPIDIVMINTNGVRLASDQRLLDELAQRNRRCEVYLQFDGLDQASSQVLRGEPLLETKLRAIEELGRRDIRTILVCTVETGVNTDQLGELVRFGAERPWITGI
ncbi:MAG: radical SAM protein, partial [Planctomycetaceae bacterium]